MIVCYLCCVYTQKSIKTYSTSNNRMCVFLDRQFEYQIFLTWNKQRNFIKYMHQSPRVLFAKVILNIYQQGLDTFG